MGPVHGSTTGTGETMMSSKTIGRGRFRSRSKLLIGLAAASLVLAGLTVGAAYGVHDEAFELDRDVAEASSPGSGERRLGQRHRGCGRHRVLGPAVAAAERLLRGHGRARLHDSDSTRRRTAQTGDDSTFTTNSKDILDISAQWRCVHANNVTDKGDLVNTYAVAYTNAAGQLIFYFGAEKNDASGTNNIGVWFLQDQTVDCSDSGGGKGPRSPGPRDRRTSSSPSSPTVAPTRSSRPTCWDPTDPAAVNNLVQLGTADAATRSTASVWTTGCARSPTSVTR